MSKYLDTTGLQYLWSKIKSYITNAIPTSLSAFDEDSTHRLVSDAEKAVWDAKLNAIDSTHKLSADLITDGTNNKVYTSTEKTKLSGIEEGAEVNVQSDWSQNTTTADDYIKNRPKIYTNSNGTYIVDNFIALANTEGDPVILVGSNEAYYKLYDFTSIVSGALAGSTAYQKPSTGIPKTDLNSSVQTSLGLADTALQSYTETDPVFAASAAAGITSSNISTWNSKQNAISDLATIRSNAANAIPSSEKGTAGGVCPLDTNSKIDATYLPSYVDDVVEAYPRSGQTELSSTWLATGSASGAVITPESGKIYLLMASTTNYTVNTQFRWGGTTYVKLNDGGISAMTTSEMDTATNNWT